MDHLDHAAQILDRLRAMLEAELVQARGQRLLIRALDTQGLFERARQRSAFNAQLAQLERALGEALESAGHALGLEHVTLVELGKAAPEASQRLDACLADVRALANALREIDAVNLMTVHAAKGLEFPVVFVVNLSRGAGGPPPPIRIAPNEPGVDAVAVGDYRSDADQDAGERDNEEIKRLLYVAVTRARDRLYLASVVKNGTLSPGRGSLASVMPASFRSLFAEAARQGAEPREIEWRAASGRTHLFRCCAPASPGDDVVEALRDSGFIGPAPGAADGADDFDAMDAGDTPTHTAVTTLSATAGGDQRGRAAPPEGDRVIAGRLVHRLFQAGARADEPDSLVALALRLITADERLEVEDADALAVSAVDVFTRMRSKPDVQALLERSTCLYEVPVSMTGGERPGVVARGVIDCLVRLPDGDMVVLDFKTGLPRDSDRRQLEMYVGAVRDLFPGAAVRGQLVYP